MNRMPLSKFETMQSEHFDTLVRQAADDPKELSQAVNLSRFTDHMLTQQHEAEEMDQLVSHRPALAASPRAPPPPPSAPAATTLHPLHPSSPPPLLSSSHPFPLTMTAARAAAGPRAAAAAAAAQQDARGPAPHG